MASTLGAAQMLAELKVGSNLDKVSSTLVSDCYEELSTSITYSCAHLGTMGVMRGTLPLGTTETERLGPYRAWIAALGDMVSYMYRVIFNE